MAFHVSIIRAKADGLAVTVTAVPKDSGEATWKFDGPWEKLRRRLPFFAIEGAELFEVDDAVRADQTPIFFDFQGSLLVG